MNTEQNQQNTVAEYNNSWKGRGSLANLLKELERQKETRVDFVSDTRHFGISVEKEEEDRMGQISLVPQNEQAREWLPDGAIPFNRSSWCQLAAKCSPSIPRIFFENLASQNPDRLETLIN